MSLRSLQQQLVAERERVLSELGLDEERRGPPDPLFGKRRRTPEPRVPPELARRSPRVSAIAAARGSTDLVRLAGGASAHRARHSAAADSLVDSERDDDSEEEERASAPRVLNAPAPGSVRATAARVDYMTERYLGLPIPKALGGPGNQAKRAVMTEASAIRGRCPTFSRMSGVQVWTNAIFLFVNVASGDNEFLDSGREVTWFAQNTMTMKTPTLLRLIHHATGYPVPPAATGSASAALADARAGALAAAAPQLDPCSVVLICRIGTEPYVWCGLLDYMRHDPHAKPIKFWWRLRDFSRLSLQAEFKRVLAEAAR